VKYFSAELHRSSPPASTFSPKELCDGEANSIPHGFPLHQLHIVASGSQTLSAPGPKSCGEFDPATGPLLRA